MADITYKGATVSELIVPAASGTPDDDEPTRITLAAGSGSLPVGGTTGEVLTKASDADGDVEWSAGGGSQPALYAVAALVRGSNIDVSTGTLDPLENEGTIDGLTLGDGDRILLASQDEDEENGIWLARAGAWERPDDFADGATLPAIPLAFVSDGSQWAGALIVIQNADDDTGPGIVVGTTRLQITYLVPVDAFTRTTESSAVGIGVPKWLAHQDAGNHQLVGLPQPSASSGAATKGYVDDRTAAFVDPLTATAGQVAEAMITVGLMAGS